MYERQTVKYKESRVRRPLCSSLKISTVSKIIVKSKRERKKERNYVIRLKPTYHRHSGIKTEPQEVTEMTVKKNKYEELWLERRNEMHKHNTE